MGWLCGNNASLAVASHGDAVDFALQTFEYHRRYVSAAIHAVVYDESLLFELGIDIFGKKAVADFCKCNVFKYTFRSGEKQPKTSIEKAKWYLEKYMELAPEFIEEWKICKNGIYEVSSLGNIRRVGNDKN